MTYEELIKTLFENRNEKFAAFSKSLSHSEYISIGVKNPELRAIIKEHKKDPQLLLSDFELGKYLEVDFIYFGLALSRLQTIDEQLSFLQKEIKKAKSWVIVDSVPTFLKKHRFQDYQSYFFKTYKSKDLYERRSAYVLGLKHYRDKNILSLLPHFTLNEEYMVYMAQAWLLSFTAIKYPEEVFSYLSSISDEKLIRKTVSKICDSFRFSQEQKEHFKSLRKGGK